MGTGLYLDLRGYLKPSQVDTYQVRFDSRSFLPVTASWPGGLSSYVSRCDMIDEVTGNIVNVNMLDSTNVTITDSRVIKFLIITQGTAGWIAQMPDTGTVLPGGNTNLMVKINTRDLHGGMFHTNLKIASNDPGNPDLRVPVQLKVLGQPNLALSRDTLNFGNSFVNFPDTLLLVVSNNGSDTLHVNGISSDNPRFDVLGAAMFDLADNSSHGVLVRSIPTAVVADSGTLAIASNDPSDPIFKVHLMGNGVNPPVMVISPDSLMFTLNEGDSASASIIIGNHGLTDLNWRATLSSSSVPAAVPFSLPSRVISLSRYVGGESLGLQRKIGPQKTDGRNRLPEMTTNLLNLSGKRIGTNNLFDYTVIENDLVTRFAKVYYISFPLNAGKLETLDVLEVEDAIGFATPSDIAIIRGWVQGGGSIFIQWDDVSSSSNINAILSGSGITENFIGTYADAVFTNIAAHETTVGIDSINASAYGAYSTVTPPALAIVKDNFGRPNIVVSSLGKGRVLVSGNEVTSDVNLAYDTRRFSNQLFDWLTMTTELVTITPTSGIVVPGDAEAMQLKIKTANLDGGTIRDNILITSNDPGRPRVQIPIDVRVIGQPNLVISMDTLDFGDAYVGYPDILPIVMSNIGSDTLHVTGVSSTTPTFRMIGSRIFDVPQHKFHNLLVAFTPSIVGADSGALSIVSNDPRHPTISVRLRGFGVPSPRVRVAPEALSTSLGFGDSTTLSMTIFNDGERPLQFVANEHAVKPEIVGAPAPGIVTRATMRGNIYRVANISTLEEFSTNLEIPQPTLIQFAVYEASRKAGPYHRLNSVIVYLPDSGRGFYSSGALSTILHAGMYYFLGTATFDYAKFFSIPQVLPANYSFGQAVQSGSWAYDETHTEITPAFNSTTVWNQSLTVSGRSIRSITPGNGTIGSGGSLKLIFEIQRGLSVGLISSQILLTSNDPGKTMVRIPLNVSVSISSPVTAGWNLLSIPRASEDNRTRTMFPSATSHAFSYAGKYVDAESLRSATGYWLKFSSEQFVPVGGEGMGESSIPVRTGWNLVGAPPYFVNLAGIQSIPPGNIVSHFIGYSSAEGYFSTDSILPGRGYWIRALGNGELITTEPLVSAAVLSKSAGDLAPSASTACELLNSLTFTDAAGTARKLYFSSSAAGKNSQWSELPPPAPAGVFGVRFASQRLVQIKENSVDPDDCIIRLSEGVFPVIVRWTISEKESGQSLIIRHEDGTSDIVPMSKSGSTLLKTANIAELKLVIGEGNTAQLPKDFELYQNYPNPFNPSTRIRFDLPKPSRIRLSLYNMLGDEVVRLLDDQEYDAGVQMFDWHGVDKEGKSMPSGVYFYRLSATSIGVENHSFSKTCKLLILR